MADDQRSSRKEGLSADGVGLKSELDFLRTLADILCPPNGDPADVQRALQAISTMRMALSRAPRSESPPPEVVTGWDGLKFIREPFDQTSVTKIAMEHGAISYSPPPMRAVRGLSFTYEQLLNFARYIANNVRHGERD